MGKLPFKFDMNKEQSQPTIAEKDKAKNKSIRDYRTKMLGRRSESMTPIHRAVTLSGVRT